MGVTDMDKYIKASDGRDIRLSTIPEPFGGIEYGHPIPMMDRDEARANTTIRAAGFELSYDSRGYCYKRVKV